MSYQHMFYGLDLARLQSTFGCRDEVFLEEVLEKQAEELADVDEFVGGDLDELEMPTAENALREIFAGSIGDYTNAAPMFGYVLKILCTHLGQPIGTDVACVRDHPFKSQLVAAGPPIPIPYDKTDFPEIGYLSLTEIPAEIARLDQAPHRAKRSFFLTLLNRLSGGIIGRQMSDEDVIQDMQAYRETLQEALTKRLSIVSFRH